MSGARTLTVVVPVYDEERWIASTLQDLDAAAARAPALAVDVVVVDDGSADGTVGAALAAETALPVRIVEQANAGRQAARARGLREASGDLVLFLDSRVSLRPGSIAFVERRLAEDPADAVWNAHVEIERDGNPYGLFWNVLTELAFSAYFADPRTTYFDARTFDAFPKGTTCFLAPRELLLAAFGAHASLYADPRNANDDTPMIRRIADGRPIGISPEFSCLYRPRDRLRPFLKHAFHRGVVFLDGHGRRSSRFFPAVAGFYPLSLALAAATVRRPVVAPVALAALGAGAGALALVKRRPRDETAAFAALTPVYAVAHGLGMWKGLALALRAKLDGGRAR